MDTEETNQHYLTPLSEKLKDLENKGYKHPLTFVHGVMKDDTGKTYQASDLKIVEEYRFEGESNPDDMSILYAVESNDGDKGAVVTSYGVYADELAAFMKDVEEVRK